MLKIITILFTCYFSIISSGVMYSKHYCGDIVSQSLCGIDLDAAAKCFCSHESTEHSKDCCKSETTVLKCEGDKFNPSVQNKFFTPFELRVLFAHDLKFIAKRDGVLCDTYVDFRPPPEASYGFFILFRSLLI